jgi:hypothetical protein
MPSKSFALLLVVALAGVAAAPLSAQSLADVARKEEVRRKAIKQPTKVVTNKDLGSVPAIPPAQAQKAPGSAAVPAVEKDEPAKDAKDGQKPEGDTEKGQAYWVGRLKDLRTEGDRDQTLADALQTRVNSLLTDYVSRSDPAQRAVIERDRQKATGELEAVKQHIQKNKKAIADLQEEGRRAGVPAGWLR